MDFAVPADHRMKLKESEKSDLYLDLARELKKLWNLKVTLILIVIGGLGTVTKQLVQEQKDLEIRARDYPNSSIIKIGQNSEKSPGDLRRFVFTRAPIKNHQLTLITKTC